MDIARHPELLERLAAGYALGTLRGGARRRFEQLAREHAGVRAAALLWQGRWSALAELQPPVPPDDAVWIRIDNLLQAEKARAAQPARQRVAAGTATGGWRASLALWRGAALVGACATLASMAVGLWGYQDLRTGAQLQIAALLQQLQAAPQLEYVAVLADQQSAAAMLVTFDPKHRTLTLQRVGDFREAADKSLQLWALPPAGGPRSLGVLGSSAVLNLPASENEVKSVPALAISLEPKGGVPGAGGPTGPVLFKGALIQRALGCVAQGLRGSGKYHHRHP